MTQSTVIVHDFKKGDDLMATPEALPYIPITEIMALIPHRYPMLLIDRVEDVHLGASAVGIKNVSLNEWYFQGHFPDKPILPGVLIIEAMAQTAAVLVMKTLSLEDKLVYFMSVEEAKFRKPVTPGDVMRLKVTKEKNRGVVWKFKGEALVEGHLAAEATFAAMIADK
ncbi:MAG: 3-hydroxyacyl-(acyl-carrier-protein) dehydratase [Alphaproteobacteria bacterium]|jgi:3-hydroxyacyl-[acyl-carrier-protein] dehydratase|nr:3-hydroxyacyl-(acyl-carrier-protein) dehydratase [Alphaproteobacteria bacterium]